MKGTRFIKAAKTIDEQIDILKSRNVTIDDIEKAKEILLDIGYYRLGFYLFPFEISYPLDKDRTHKVHDGTRIESAVGLYYFDFDLRNLLLRYINRIEVALRTYITYYISTKYNDKPTWFIHKGIVTDEYIRKFRKQVYTQKFKDRNQCISRHEKKYGKKNIAPAWKTVEFMTFGQVLVLYKSLLHSEDQEAISKYFEISNVKTFMDYMDIVLLIRNRSAHGHWLFDFNLPKSAMLGPIRGIPFESMAFAISVILYFIEKISDNRQLDLINGLVDITRNAIDEYPELQPIIKRTMGISIKLTEKNKESVAQLKSLL